MGYMRHHAIVVTARESRAEGAHAKALEVFHGVAEVTPLTATAINGYQSFMVAPDGSKEWWADSDNGNAARDAFVEWLKSARLTDWVEVQFADDEGDTRVTRSSQHYEDGDE